MIELMAKTIGTQVAAAVAKEVADHSGEIVEGSLEMTGDAIIFVGDCVCDVLNGIGRLFDP